jgi:hypothetical protein
VKKLSVSILLIFSLFCGFAFCQDDAPIAVTGDWTINRIWKTAKDGYHFYEGTLPFKNISNTDITGLKALITILDPNGDRINDSGWIEFGDFQSGKTLAKPYKIMKAVQYSELVVKAVFAVNGEEKTLSFSATPGQKPTIVQVKDNGVMEVRVLSHEIERTIIGKKQDKLSTLTVRLRNLSNVSAGKPTAKIEFKVPTVINEEKDSKKGKKSKRKSKKEKTAEEDGKNAKPAAKAKTVTMSVVLSDEELKGGETKTYIKKIDAPENVGYSLGVSVDWPQVEVQNTVTGTTAEVTGDGATIIPGKLDIIKQEDGTATLTQSVTNYGDDIAAGELFVVLHFRDKKNKEVHKVKIANAEAIKKGGTSDLIAIGEKLPAYSAYEIELMFK